ncbi:PDZ domain-containing RING finger protein 4-like [Herpailurus yagouaroundi]|uniref:PDZ domain-containing RING finger protein 4-like n=1 Tax=Herpailurus yagouaroundi TaxID=1608482 RepID=UPI001AD62266|nr:PDZ domain-containing RING finger protein 4-like [Puma yagouaroundi]
MGFALERFAEAVDPDFECKLCGQVLEEPLCTPCGHVFCASCLLPWVERRRRCPLQCQPLAPGKLCRVLPLRSLIQKLRIQCDYRARGCGRSVPLGRGPRPRVLAWRRREKALLAQLWALQGEVQLSARRYQEKFAQYMAHVRNFARDLGGGHGPKVTSVLTMQWEASTSPDPTPLSAPFGWVCVAFEKDFSLPLLLGLERVKQISIATFRWRRN